MERYTGPRYVVLPYLTENSVQDNLYTIQTVFAAYRSMEENCPVTLNEA
jgi:hypothetical protein